MSDPLDTSQRLSAAAGRLRWWNEPISFHFDLSRTANKGNAGAGSRGYSKRPVLGDNECFVRENPSMVTERGVGVRESYGLLAFNPHHPTQWSNGRTENVTMLCLICLCGWLSGKSEWLTCSLRVCFCATLHREWGVRVSFQLGGLEFFIINPRLIVCTLSQVGPGADSL